MWNGIDFFMKFDEELILYPSIENCTIAVIGLGYVGLPIAIEFSKIQNNLLNGKKLKRKVIGFDINKQRIIELQNGFDKTNEIDMKNLPSDILLKFTNDINHIYEADVFIVTVPTPIDEHKNPNLDALESASKIVGNALKIKKQIMYSKKTNIIPMIIFESTVYPGTTEEICIPIIEEESGLKCDNFDENKSFSCGYSPERINPGDQERSIVDIVKVTSGSNINSSKWVNNFYGSIINAGTHMAQSIKVAESAKIIENTQRDINIALVNELAKIFKLLNIDTLNVLEAASTKWNFLPFKPGLVGGHCIGVDPYYLTYKAKSLGYFPEVVLAGRRINDGMAKWIVDQIILEMCHKNISIKSANILILGFTFKEDCPDIRNTKILEMFHFLREYKMDIDIVDPLVERKSFKDSYDIDIYNEPIKNKKYSVVIASVPHRQFKNMNLNEWKNLRKQNSILFDLKGIIPIELKPLRI